MENYVLLKGNIEIIKKVCQALLLEEERLSHMVFGIADQWSKDKLKRTPDDIYELCKKYLWLCELGRGYMVSFLAGPEQA